MIENISSDRYSVQAAIADIIDNSISANAKNIWVDFDWKGSNTCYQLRMMVMG
jgi:hypothetical protein